MAGAVERSMTVHWATDAFSSSFENGLYAPSLKGISWGSFFRDFLIALVGKCAVGTEEKASKKLDQFARKMAKADAKDKDLYPPKWAVEIMERHKIRSETSKVATWRGVIIHATTDPAIPHFLAAASNESARGTLQDSPSGDSVEETQPPQDAEE